MEIPDKVSLTDMLKEVRRRVTVRKHDFFLVDVVIGKPGFCECNLCILERAQLHQNLHARTEDLACQNKQWLTYCDTHEVFHHPADTCPYCERTEDEKKMWSPWPRRKTEIDPAVQKYLDAKQARQEYYQASLEQVPQSPQAQLGMSDIFCPACQHRHEVIWGSHQIMTGLCEKCNTPFQVGRPNGKS